MEPIANLTAAQARAVRVVFSDGDDTLTNGGRIPWWILQTARQLTDAGVSFCLVTGRPVGFGVTLTNYFEEIALAITENGGMLSVRGSDEFLFPKLAEPEHMRRIGSAASLIQRRFPQIRESAGNYMRRTDFAFLREPMTDEEIERMAKLAETIGVHVVASSIQIHLFRGGHNKGTAIEEVLKTRFPGVERGEVLVMGDSANDESMFDPSRFPLSAGVANVKHYADAMDHLPRYVASAEGADGAREILGRILDAKSA